MNEEDDEDEFEDNTIGGQQFATLDIDMSKYYTKNDMELLLE